MSGYLSQKIKFHELQVGDIVSDNNYKHYSEVTDRIEFTDYVTHIFDKENTVQTKFASENFVHVHRKSATNG